MRFKIRFNNKYHWGGIGKFPSLYIVFCCNILWDKITEWEKICTRIVYAVSQCQKNLLDFRREKSEMKIEEDLILYLLKRN